MTGEVKSYNISTRYGFITDGHVDYRFHREDWQTDIPPYKGLTVEFTPTFTEKGWRASEITNN